MAEYYVGEIRMFAGAYAPQGWAFCDGRLINIYENEVLFALIGTTYGGDGRTTFALPDLRGRVPIHQGTSPKTGTNFPLGQNGGTETVTLTTNQLPSHSHTVNACKEPGDVDSPSGALWAATSGYSNYTNGDLIPSASMDGSIVSSVGGNQPHDNIMASTAISFIIALNGLFPQQA